MAIHAHSDIIEIPAKGSIRLEVKTLKIEDEIVLAFQALTGIIAPNQHPSIELKVQID